MNLFPSCTFFLIFLFSSCQKEPPPKELTTTFSNRIMTIDYIITIGEKLSAEKTMNAQAIINETFDEVDRIYNKWNPNSEVSKLNQMKGHQIKKISPELERLLYQAQKIVQLSQGNFDPTIEPLQQLWRTHLKQGTVPSDESIAALGPAIGWDKIHFGKGFFSKDHDITRLDLGGIAKGLLVDLLVERLNQAGYEDVFVEWGGEIRASGRHPEGRDWKIFISRQGNPNPEMAVAHLSLHNQAIATSGDYQQYWEIKNSAASPSMPAQSIIYFHIIHPKTRRPLTIRKGTISSASVLANECWLADGLATAAMLFDNINQAKIWADEVRKEIPSLTFWFVLSDINDDTTPPTEPDSL